MSNPDDVDPWRRIRANHDELEQIADRDDSIGALASITLALANGDHPSDTDLQQIGATTRTEADQ